MQPIACSCDEGFPHLAQRILIFGRQVKLLPGNSSRTNHSPARDGLDSFAQPFIRDLDLRVPVECFNISQGEAERILPAAG